MNFLDLLLFPVFLLHAYILNPKLRREIDEELDREIEEYLLREKLEERYG